MADRDRRRRAREQRPLTRSAAPAANSRAEVLALLNGQRSGRVPCFSGLISVTLPGLQAAGLQWGETYHDPAKMARAAASTYRLSGFESAVLPLNLYVEAAALGVPVDYRADSELLEWPRVTAPLPATAQDFNPQVPADLAAAEPVARVLAGLRLLRQDVGQEIVVGAVVPGPFTLATLTIRLAGIVKETRKAPEAVGRVLDLLTDVIAEVALAYRAAGADFITVHEMGGSPGFLGPPAFTQFVLPRLQRLFAALPGPRVLSVCGDTNASMAALAEAGADALSVEQSNDLARSRAALGADALLFGNLDPIGTLALGDEAGVRRATEAAIAAGADAVWPGCDLWPEVPAANLRAMVQAAGAAGHG